MKFFDNMTGKQKLILIFGGVVLAVAVQVLFPEEIELLWTMIEDTIHHVVDSFGGNS